MNHLNGPPQVMTVLGPISADELGVTLVHEHMAFGFPGWSADESVVPYDPAAIEAKCLGILEDVKGVGVRTVIDATPCDVGGRDPVILKNLAEKTGLHIIASTGLYYEKDGGPPISNGSSLRKEISSRISMSYLCRRLRSESRGRALRPVLSKCLPMIQ